MANNYCLVIPHYCHVEPLLNMSSTLAAFDLPVFVVDDASPEQSVRKLAAGLAPYPQITLLKRASNGGKGAAMMTGLNHAVASGFSHAISIDADGQHNLDDIRALCNAADCHPDSIIAGRPVFGDDIPPARLYGRMLTNTLVQVVTASKMIKDAMCGFRIYPLRQTTPIFSQLGYRTRMEFDVEILVRACWSDIHIYSVDTDVVYPENGASHFNMIADNLRLIAMHILLILGGIVRLPKTLLRRRQNERTMG